MYTFNQLYKLFLIKNCEVQQMLHKWTYSTTMAVKYM